MNRRTLLKASGISLSLPLLEAFGKAGEAAPRRALFLCNTLGFYPPAFYPQASGPDYEPSEYLSILDGHREDFTVFSGLSHPDQGGEHACEMTWLSGARNPGRDGFENSISVDQLAARELGNVTRFSSLSLSSDGQKSQSYTDTGVMVPAMDRPSEVFAKLFLQPPFAPVRSGPKAASKPSRQKKIPSSLRLFRRSAHSHRRDVSQRREPRPTHRQNRSAL
ncbi:DUF1552 domain-containing protein [Akkermansiaceae bacterium]|nr:DUF1552 domain-containing protein [Akkermansiaceae bacterium]